MKRFQATEHLVSYDLKVSRRHLYRPIKDGKQRVVLKRTDISIRNYLDEYELWRIHNIRNSLFAVMAVESLNGNAVSRDPYENIEGCTITKVV